jgi:four helix bundle protein
MSGTYRNLKAWQSAMKLVSTIYRDSERFPSNKKYGLTSQIRRAAVSVASNIAEGKGRSSDRELVQFLNHARGSLFEIETQISIAHDLGYWSDGQTAELLDRTAEVGRILNGLIKALRVSSAA